MKYYYIAIMLLFMTGCRKNDFLDAKPNPSVVVPSTLSDYEALLNNDATMNGETYGIVPVLGETGADNYFLPDDVYSAVLKPLYRKSYTWEKDVFQDEQVSDWNLPYQSIYIANVVLDGLQELHPDADETIRYNETIGCALFFRAHAFYQLSQVFAKPYDKATAANDPGLPLRLTSSLTENLKRSSLEATYQQIITDTKTAIGLMPARPVYATQPGKAAGYGLLARLYLSMQDYTQALAYADSCLHLHHDLMDYNDLDTTGNYPFTILNSEVIFQCEMIRGTDVVPVNANYCYVDTALFDMYQSNDLRKVVFFNPKSGYHYFKGSYSGYYGMFSGIATDEIYLMRAECYARTGRQKQALEDINTLLEKRYIAGNFVPYTIANTPGVLQLVLDERRKELCFRGLRWTDLRRLNLKDGHIVLYRRAGNALYTLPPNDSRYVYPVPSPVISLNPVIEQNKR